MKEVKSFIGGFVKSGTKNVSEAAPQLILTSTYNQFKLNNKAMALLDVVIGERVALFDMKDVASTDQNDRYYMCKAGFTNEDGVEQGALIGANNSFRYSSIYPTMLLDNHDVKFTAPSDLVDSGLMVEKLGKNDVPSYIATKIGTFTLEATNGGKPSIVADGVERVVFAVTNLKLKDHTPRSIGGGDEVDEPVNGSVED